MLLAPTPVAAGRHVTLPSTLSPLWALLAAAWLGLAGCATLPASPGVRAATDVDNPARRAHADAAPAAFEFRCDEAARVVVQATVAGDALLACEGARAALNFLTQAGLTMTTGTKIEIVDQLPGAMRGQAVGCYMRDTRRIFLLTQQAFQAAGTWFRLPVEPALYRSAAAHEMAHAVVGCQSQDAPLPVPAHEYVAYVAMFATMETALRERVLARFPGKGFDNILQINTVVYVMDPLQFAADAWRHYLKRRDRAGWLRDVAAGRVVQEFPTDGP